MSHLNFPPTAVLRHYPTECQPVASEQLRGAGGLSGARVWRLNTPVGLLCLREWPQGQPTAERLRWIQAVMNFTSSQGVEFIPRIVRTLDGESFVPHLDQLWELTTWLPGQADFHDHPTDDRLTAAFRGLAKWHLAAGIFPLAVPAFGAAPGIAERQRRLVQLQQGRADALQGTLREAADFASADFVFLAREILQVFPAAAYAVAGLLKQAELVCLPWQPVLRDVWHEHLLFTGDVLTGLIDFGALRIDTVAADLARLLRSLVGDDPVRRAFALAAYDEVRPLTDEERALIHPFDLSGVLLSALQWIEWLLLERRHFANQAAAQTRAVAVGRECLKTFTT